MNPDHRSYLLAHLQHGANEQVAELLRRATVQTEFAQGLCDLLGRDDWRPLLEQAEAALDATTVGGGVEGLRAAVSQAETILAPLAETAKSYTIWNIAHGHIDMNWMWSWPETVAATHDTFASVLGLMREYPELTYSQSQASVYVIAKRFFPAQFAEIQERVREGRWEVTASQWVEGDKNLASGEALCAHLLLTRRAMAEMFDLSPEDVPIDWEPDTFGHAHTIPSILAQGGVRYYYSCRQGGGFDHERTGEPRPALYWWEGPDGARILVNRETTWYNSYVSIGENIAAPLIAFCRETGLRDWMNVYGFGNHGGGPTRREIDYYSWLSKLPIYPSLRFGTAKGYFEQVLPQADSLPVVTGDLNFEFTGCYSSQSLIKQANRLGENYMVEAAALTALAERLTGSPVPAANLRDGWEKVLFSQFHDILPGSGVRQTREYASAHFQEVAAIAGAAKRTAGVALASRLDTAALLPATELAEDERALLSKGSANTAFVAGAGSGSGLSGLSRAATGGRRFLPFVVFNPCAWPRTERVEVSLYDTGFDVGRIVARDELGHQTPTLLREHANDWGHDRLTVSFEARDVPALGYRTYLLCEGVADAQGDGVVYGPHESFETPSLSFRLARHTGALIDLVDKRSGARFGSPRPTQDGLVFGAWESIVELPWTMTAWVLGEEDRAATTLLRSPNIGVHGGHRNEATMAAGGGSPAVWAECRLAVPNTKSSVHLIYSIPGSAPRIDVTAHLDWREIGDGQRGIPGLRTSFACDQLAPLRARYEAPFGSLERDLTDGQEVPSLRYAHLSGQVDGRYAGLTVLQDSRYSHSLQGADLRLRMVRSTFDPDHAPEVAQQAVRYSLVFHDSEPTPADLARLGAEWNHPLIAFPANLQEGTAATCAEQLRCESENAVVTAVKQADSGQGLVLRLVELNGQAGEAAVVLSEELAAGLGSAQRVDLLERPVEGEVNWSGGRLVLPLKAHELATVLLR